MHDDIRKFDLEGELGEPNVVTTRDRLVDFVEESMRDYGYVPALDIEPQFTLDYNMETESFNFKLTVYGIEVGKERACKLGGILSGKEIVRYSASK